MMCHQRQSVAQSWLQTDCAWLARCHSMRRRSPHNKLCLGRAHRHARATHCDEYQRAMNSGCELSQGVLEPSQRGPSKERCDRLRQVPGLLPSSVARSVGEEGEEGEDDDRSEEE